MIIISSASAAYLANKIIDININSDIEEAEITIDPLRTELEELKRKLEKLKQKLRGKTISIQDVKDKKDLEDEIKEIEDLIKEFEDFINDPNNSPTKIIIPFDTPSFVNEDDEFEEEEYDKDEEYVDE